MSYVLDFRDIDRADLPHVGGKGANLGVLAAAGLPVPPGFCVTTAAFRRVVADAALDAPLAALDAVRAGDVDAARSAGLRLREALLQVDVPQDIQDAILTAWRAAGEERAYAVRSSATAEDLPEASFAGQQDTYLNVVGATALIEHVRRCWASLFTDRAILYRIEQGIGHREVALAVVVQRMVLPQKSGIMFTADPLTGHRHTTSIDAGFGLGEALVSGLVNADLYRVDRRAQRVVEARPGDKALAIVPVAGGGTRKETLPDSRRRARVLDDAEALELSRLGARIQELQGAPQDIEWCIEDGVVYIVQARPITSLYPAPPPGPDGALGVYFCFNHFQVMTDAMPPLTCALWSSVIPVGKDLDHLDDPTPGPWTRVLAGRVYMDLGSVLRRRLPRRLLTAALRGADRLAAAAVRELTGRAEFQRGPRVRARSVRRFFLPRALELQKWLWLRDPDGVAEDRARWIDGLLAEMGAAVDAQPTAAARLRRARDEIVVMFPKLLWLPPIILAGVLASALLRKIARPEPGEVEALGRALPHNVTTHMDLDVGDLADAARGHPALCDALRRGVGERDALARLPGGEAFVQQLDVFLERHGHRAPSEIDVSRPRWREDPSSVLRVVAGNLAHGQAGAHRAHHKELAEQAEATARRLVARAARGLLGRPRARVVRRLIRVLRGLAGLREHPKLAIVRALDVLRRQVLAAGDELVAAGCLDQRDDAWLFTVDELADICEATAAGAPRDARALVSTRREQFARDQKLYPPRVITSDGESPNVRHEVEVPEGALAGSPASSGVAVGRARVITDPASEVLEKGEILVAPFTDPGWTPLFINAAGLVMEVGGLMTHGSVVAREYGIPAVVCIPDATRRIRTGDRVRVHGDGGYVEILEVRE